MHPAVEFMMAKRRNKPLRFIVRDMPEERIVELIDYLEETELMIPIVLAHMGLPQPTEKSFWAAEVLPVLREALIPPEIRPGKVNYRVSYRDIKDRTDIVDYAGKFTVLKSTGNKLRGPCPIHNEQEPSFYVYPETQSFYCFGCKEGGDVISLAKALGEQLDTSPAPRPFRGFEI